MSNKLNSLRDALDAAYPIPDNPHESVKQRASDNRTAFIQGWQAATEAAKATGTAGELPPLPEPVGKLERRLGVFQSNIEIHDVHTAEQMREYGQACAEAARQPAPVVAVKTWQERTRAYEEKWYRLPPPREVFMQDEIADLRAALAATNRSQP